MKPNRSLGFTLIELLIVVAIIAILAAIAVPNFLEAQTRSKVSRVKSDMRSLATAIEAYQVDNNKYPPDYNPAIQLYWSFLPRLLVLTTPIAYITAVPEDVFAAASISQSTLFDDPYRIPYGSGPLVRPYPFDYAYRLNANGDSESLTVWERITQNPESVLWALRSVGPDLEATVLGWSGVTVYDPTNGTLSRGDIFYTGPGKGFDQPKN
jgi:type II secretion system protein G